jgi:hypothetical protein
MKTGHYVLDMIADIDIWRTARLLMRQRADELLEVKGFGVDMDVLPAR